MQCMVALKLDKFCNCYATKTFKRFRSCLSWGTISSYLFLEYFRYWNWKLLFLIVCWASVNDEGHQTDLRQDFLPYWPSQPLIEIITITTANTTNTTLPIFVCNVYLVKKRFTAQTICSTDARWHLVWCCLITCLVLNGWSEKWHQTG